MEGYIIPSDKKDVAFDALLRLNQALNEGPRSDNIHIFDALMSGDPEARDRLMTDELFEAYQIVKQQGDNRNNG